MINQILTWWKNILTKENPPATFFRWMSIKKTTPTIINWSGEIEDQWSLEGGSSSFMMDWECGYPRAKRENIL